VQALVARKAAGSAAEAQSGWAGAAFGASAAAGCSGARAAFGAAGFFGAAFFGATFFAGVLLLVPAMPRSFPGAWTSRALPLNPIMA
jgi:hypothetical protein